MAATRTNTAGLDRKLAKVQQEMRGAAEALVRQQAGAFIRFTQLASPRDTNRYIRAWAQAGNAAGVAGAPFQEAELRRTRYAAKLALRLELQVLEFERIVRHWTAIVRERYVLPGREGKWKTDAEKKLDRALKRLQRAKDEYREFQVNPYAIVIFRKRTKSGGLEVTTREKVYGGSGWLAWDGDRPLLYLHNREPHASIVEKNNRVVARGRAYVKATGGRTFGRAYSLRLAKAGKA